MTPHSSQPGAALRKETRALLPTFASCAVALSLAPFTPVFPSPFILLVFCAGAIALGAQSIGHEYGHHTLGLLLAQPSERRRVFLRKIAVLLGMVLALALLAAVVLRIDNGALRVRAGVGPREQTVVLVFVAAAAVCLAPWLSMLCRGTLPSLVFTIAIPGLLMLAGEVAGTVKYGFRDPEMVASFRNGVLWWGMSTICLVSAVAGWRMFMRLEAIEGHREIQLPRWWRDRREAADGPSRLRVQNPLWLLVGKELRLQQMTFVVVALYVAGWTSVALLERFAPEFPRIPLEALTALYVVVLAVLIGSLASAEERQLGTLPWQTLLPVAASKQWLIKAATAIGLTLLLGIAVPVVLMHLFAAGGNLLPHGREWEKVAGLLLITSASLYVSSLSTSGVRAMVVSLPVIVGSLAYSTVLGGIVISACWRMFYEDYIATAGTSRDSFATWLEISHLAATRSREMILIAGLAIALALLRFAFVNHRTVERNMRRVAVQASILVLLLTLALLTPVAVWAYYAG